MLCSQSRIPMVIDAGNAGTVLRFLSAFLVLQDGKWLLTGSERMKQRPIKDLVDALKSLGAKITYPERTGFPPMRIKYSNLRGGEVELDGSVSSQFISALMMIAPYLPDGLKIHIKNQPVSWPYVNMTVEIMRGFGVSVYIADKEISIVKSDYQIKNLFVEPDWSSASYWYELVALSKDADVFIPGLLDKSVQGDRVCADIFKSFGVESIFEKGGVRLKKTPQQAALFSYDFTHCPDLVPAVLATCAALGIRSEISGVKHLQYKESDRMLSLGKELVKIGTGISADNDIFHLEPGNLRSENPIVFETYGDHRIAMCLASLAMKFESVTINDPDVVEKSYPDFWCDIQQFGLFDVDKN